MKTTTLILMAIVLIGATTSQTYRQDYQKIVDAYQSKKSISFSVQYKSFDTSPTIPDTVFTGKYNLKGEQFHVKISNTESIKNGKYYFSIDHTNKMMFLHSAKSAAGNFFPISTIDTLLIKKALEIKVEDFKEGKERRYTVNYSKLVTQFKSMVMEFDLKTFLIHKVVLRLDPPENEYDEKDWNYIDQPFVEFHYLDYNFSELNDNVFAIDKYIDIKNEINAVAKPAFKNYAFINSLAASKQIR
jgi:hypothetical protein